MRQHTFAGQPPLRTRIAPTPSGYLHLGNTLSFAITWALARQQHGTVVLRIDDLDNARFRLEYLQDIFDTLQLMGLDYDEGPGSPTDFLQHYSQHQRLTRYHTLLHQLTEQGILYACPCSRKQLSALQPGQQHACLQERLPLHTPDVAWRIHIPEGTEVTFSDLLLQDRTIALATEMPDFVVCRKEGIPAYQIASLADDLEMGINLIVRGEDLLTSTAAQLYMAQLLPSNKFPASTFLHHPVVLEPNGNKLSKSHASLSIKEMRQSGFSSKALWKMIAAILGLKEEHIGNAQDFLDSFSLDKLRKVKKYNLRVDQ